MHKCKHPANCYIYLLRCWFLTYLTFIPAVVLLTCALYSKRSLHWVRNFHMYFFIFVILKIHHAQKHCTLKVLAHWVQCILINQLRINLQNNTKGRLQAVRMILLYLLFLKRVKERYILGSSKPEMQRGRRVPPPYQGAAGLSKLTLGCQLLSLMISDSVCKDLKSSECEKLCVRLFRLKLK